MKYIAYKIETLGAPKVFDSRKEARDACIAAGHAELPILESIGTCKRCGSPLFPSFNGEYTSQCFNCEEDFYGFEQDVYSRGEEPVISIVVENGLVTDVYTQYDRAFVEVIDLDTTDAEAQAKNKESMIRLNEAVVTGKMVENYW